MAGDAQAKDSSVPSSVLGSEAKNTPRDSTFSRSACEECQRRKQKCDRGWPCNHCQKRKVAEKCNYRGRASTVKSSSASSLQDQPSETPTESANRKRPLSDQDTNSSYLAESPDESSTSEDSDDDRDNLEALGYSASHHFVSLTKSIDKSKTRKQGTKNKKGTCRLGPGQYYLDPASSPQLQRALQVLPPRPYTDALVQNFLSNVNFHYYIIYPHGFIEEYLAWWSDRTDNRPLGVQWTCLLLMICACSAQYTDEDLQTTLESDLSETVQVLTERYHNAARELHSIIPISNRHLINVQQLLHSCFWYKSEIRFVECWHVLGAAIREAQELGIHQESSSIAMPEFEREMRRRVWCVLNTWDWQISALLSRPMLINRAECDVQLPSLSLEGYSPSPLLHLKLQSQLIEGLARRFELPKYVVKPDDVREYKEILEEWMSNFPPTYDLSTPDKSQDQLRPWITLHRHYLHTMAYSMTLDPIRAYLTTEISSSSSPDVLAIRDSGVDYALRLMKTLHGFFDHVWPRDAKFHFVLFAIFDTASVLCSAIIHDLDGRIPREAEALGAIENAVSMLRRLQELLPSAKMSYDLLLKFWKKAKKLSSHGLVNIDKPVTSRKKQRVASIPPGQSLEKPAQLSKASNHKEETNNHECITHPADLAFADQPSPHISSVPSTVIHGDGQSSMPPLLYDSSFFNGSIHVSHGPQQPLMPPDIATIHPGFANASLGGAPEIMIGQVNQAPIGHAPPEMLAGGLAVQTSWPGYHFNGTDLGLTLPEDELNRTYMKSTSNIYGYNGQHPLPRSFSNGFDLSPNTEYVDGGEEGNLGLAQLMENEASGFANVWDWKSLDLDFVPPSDKDQNGLY